MPSFIQRKYKLFNDQTNIKTPVSRRISGKMKSMYSCLDLRAWNLNDEVRREFLIDLLSSDENSKGMQIGSLLPMEIILDNLFFNVLSNCEFLRRRKENEKIKSEKCPCKMCKSLYYGFQCPCKENKSFVPSLHHEKTFNLSKPNKNCNLCKICRNVICKCPQNICNSCPKTGRCILQCKEEPKPAKKTSNVHSVQRATPVSFVQIKNKFQWNTLKPHPAMSTFSRGYLSSFEMRPSGRLQAGALKASKTKATKPDLGFSKNTPQVWNITQNTIKFGQIVDRTLPVRISNSKSTSQFKTFKSCNASSFVVRPKSESSGDYKSSTRTSYSRNITVSKSKFDELSLSSKPKPNDTKSCKTYQSNLTQAQIPEWSPRNNFHCENPSFVSKEKQRNCGEQINELRLRADRNSKLLFKLPKKPIEICQTEKLKVPHLKLTTNVPPKKDDQVESILNSWRTSKSIGENLIGENKENFGSRNLNHLKSSIKSSKVGFDDNILKSPEKIPTPLYSSKKHLPNTAKAEEILHSWKSSQKNIGQSGEPVDIGKKLNQPLESNQVVNSYLKNPLQSIETDLKLMNYLQNIIDKRQKDNEKLKQQNTKSNDDTLVNSWSKIQKQSKENLVFQPKTKEAQLPSNFSKKIQEIHKQNTNFDVNSSKSSFLKNEKANEKKSDNDEVKTRLNKSFEETSRDFNARINSLINAIKAFEPPTPKISQAYIKSSQICSKTSKIQAPTNYNGKLSNEKNTKPLVNIFRCNVEQYPKSSKSSKVSFKFSDSSYKIFPCSSLSKSKLRESKVITDTSQSKPKLVLENKNTVNRRNFGYCGSSEESSQSLKCSSAEQSTVGDKDLSSVFNSQRSFSTKSKTITHFED